jgi:hypothetical protein
MGDRAVACTPLNTQVIHWRQPMKVAPPGNIAAICGGFGENEKVFDGVDRPKRLAIIRLPLTGRI